MKNAAFLLSIYVLICYISGCTSFSLQEVQTLEELENLDQIDRIEVEVMEQDEQGVWVEKFTKTIDDPKQVDLVTEMFQNYSQNWRGGYIPYLPGRLTIDFFHDNRLVIAIMIAAYTNERGNLSYYLSRPAGPARSLKKTEFEQLMELLGVDENLAYYDDFVVSE
jgi:hypothetical protein